MLYNVFMKYSLKEQFNKILDFLFVNDCKCIVCGKEIVKNSKYSMCKQCLDSLPYITKCCNKCGESIKSGTICLNCKQNLPKINRNFSIFKYEPPISTLITNLKFKNQKYLAKYLSNFLVDKFLEMEIEVDYIIPVPISEKRFKVRKFNQTELLCSTFEKELNIKIENNLVARVKDTPNQTSLNRRERLINLKDCFKVLNKQKVKGKTILIVDDVYTTGATINEIATVLFNAKAKAVYGLTVAHSTIQVAMEEND